MNLDHTYAYYQYKQVIVFSKAGVAQSRPVELECDSKSICVLVFVLAIKHEYMVQSWWKLQIRFIFIDKKFVCWPKFKATRSKVKIKYAIQQHII